MILRPNEILSLQAVLSIKSSGTQRANRGCRYYHDCIRVITCIGEAVKGRLEDKRRIPDEDGIDD